ncbi:MAG TPA: type II toxin-antitoxin system VapC family toxin [Longimicrobium sp.]|nr:type II toxin-antitoxin system VapC family toxin [Longimicrobium sp.]
MNVYFFDTSALVKLHVPEAGSSEVKNILRKTRADPPSARVLVSRLAYPECMSAVARRQNAGTLSDLAARRIQGKLAVTFTGRVHAFDIADPRPEQINHAAALVARHRIRGFDAVHLATPLTMRSLAAPHHTFIFVSADVKLNAAALAEQLAVHPPLR